MGEQQPRNMIGWVVGKLVSLLARVMVPHKSITIRLFNIAMENGQFIDDLW